MKKQHFSLLIILATVGVVLAAGCLSPNQSNIAPANVTENSSTSTSSTTSSAVSRSATTSPSPSPSAIVPSASPTPTPAPSSTKIATEIDYHPGVDQPDPASAFEVTRGSSYTWALEVGQSAKQPGLLCGVPLTASIDGRSIGKITSASDSNCFVTAYFDLLSQDTSGLNPGSYKITFSFAGDNNYAPSNLVQPIIVK